MKTSAGFTLVELIVTMAVAVIVLMIAVPSYRTVTESYQISSEINGLMGDVSYARSEAIRQGLNVLVCSSSDGRTCSAASSWGNGWVVMVPTNGSCTVTAGQTAQNAQPLRVQAALTSSNTISFSPTGSNTSQGVCFSRLGTSSTGKFTLMTSSAVSSPTQYNKQCLFVAAVGLPHIIAYGKTDAVGTC
ncbi:GspH/FimT family pseudopilin [Neisseriaceae bacterium TC5R-5]|nr:GspH/FimT family pseudopilin [Neisseriaceae bacterium TC5R-5]